MKTVQGEIERLAEYGIVPYIATSDLYLNNIDTSICGGHEVVKLLERDEDVHFHRAYVFSNFLGFGGTDVEMPFWVYIDFAVLQTLIIGFAIERDKAPSALLEQFAQRPDIDLKKLSHLPISGQTAGLGVDSETLMGVSLFSIRRFLPDIDLEGLGTLTKAIGLHIQRAQDKQRFIGISQYSNAALKIHGRFGDKMYIKTPMVPLHPMADMTLIYSMKIELDDARIFADYNDFQPEYDFMLRSNDLTVKQDMSKRISAGEKFYIAPPFQIFEDEAIHLPIKVES